MDAAGGREQRALTFATVLLAIGLVAVLGARLGRPVRLAEAGASHGAVPLPDRRVDVNRCAEAELMVLPGIGPRLAERIVLDREANGPFESVAGLERVDGIGPVLRGRVEGWVVVE